MLNNIISQAKKYDPISVAVAHPVTKHAIEAAHNAAKQRLILPTLVGPEARIKQAAQEAAIDIAGYALVATEHSHEAADVACAMAAEGKVNAIMKGSLHSDELLSAVIHQRKLHTERRLSHCYVMSVPTYHKPFLVTDPAINIDPDLAAKKDIVQNAINLFISLYGTTRKPKVVLLAAVETVNPAMQATLDAAALCKMADRGQIKGAVLDGPLAFDNAISKEARDEKGIVSDVAGDPDILVAPNLEAANILAKELTFLSNAQAAGIVLGARVPVILTSRADSAETKLLSCALGVLLHNARCTGCIK